MAFGALSGQWSHQLRRRQQEMQPIWTLGLYGALGMPKGKRPEGGGWGGWECGFGSCRHDPCYCSKMRVTQRRCRDERVERSRDLGRDSGNKGGGGRKPLGSLGRASWRKTEPATDSEPVVAVTALGWEQWNSPRLLKQKRDFLKCIWILKRTPEPDLETPQPGAAP